jgi:hypothetical protein
MGRPVKPGPIVIPSCAEVVLIWDLSGQRCTNVLHGNWTLVGPVNPSLPETLFAGFKIQFTSSGWNAQCTDQLTFTGVGFRDIRYAYQPQYLSTGAAAAGVDATGPLQASASVVVTLLTSQAGAQWRGRVFLPGIGQIAMQDSRHHTQTAGSAATAFIDGIMSVMQTNTVPLVVAQRELLAGEDSHGNDLPARPASIAGVTGTKIASNRLDTQRSRLGR